jgi:hypothetical protein
LVIILLVVILSISDGLFTLHLIERGAYEENPVMAWFLNLGTWPFMIAKFLLTCSAILILLVFHNFYFRPLRLKVKTLIPVFAAVFVGVNILAGFSELFNEIACNRGRQPVYSSLSSAR